MTKQEKEMIEALVNDFTPTQIAERIGAGVTADAVLGHLRKFKMEPLTMADIYKNRLYKEAKFYSKDEMFKRLGVSRQTFDKYVAETCVHFKESYDKQAHDKMIMQQAAREMNLKKELNKGIAEFVSPYPDRKKRIREPYTQSGSPFGFADELKQIQIKTP